MNNVQLSNSTRAILAEHHIILCAKRLRTTATIWGAQLKEIHMLQKCKKSKMEGLGYSQLIQPTSFAYVSLHSDKASSQTVITSRKLLLVMGAENAFTFHNGS